MSRESKKVNRVLANLTQVERRLLVLKLHFSDDFRRKVKRTKFTKEQICENWDFTVSEYDSLYNGTHEFDLRTVCKIQQRYNDYFKSKPHGSSMTITGLLLTGAGDMAC